MMNKKGFVQNIVGGVVLAIIGLILMVGVLVPITVNVTGNQGFTGVNKTVSDNLVTFILIGALLLIVGVAFTSYRKE